MINVTTTGSTDKIEHFIGKILHGDIYRQLDTYAKLGVNALRDATPVDSGETSASWGYSITHEAGSWTISWTNSHVVEGVPIAIILQYGHATGTGGYVQGIDYINPAMRPIFEDISNSVWKAVTSA